MQVLVIHLDLSPNLGPGCRERQEGGQLGPCPRPLFLSAVFLQQPLACPKHLDPLPIMPLACLKSLDPLPIMPLACPKHWDPLPIMHPHLMKFVSGYVAFDMQSPTALPPFSSSGNILPDIQCVRNHSVLSLQRLCLHHSPRSTDKHNAS